MPAPSHYLLYSRPKKCFWEQWRELSERRTQWIGSPTNPSRYLELGSTYGKKPMTTETKPEQPPPIALAAPQEGKALKYSDQFPLRSDLLSAEQMTNHGKRLAASHSLDPRRGEALLIERLDENEEVLSKTRNLIMKAVEENRPIAPASEWLLDNFYLIKKQIRLTRQHYPKGYSRELPRLAEGPSRGYPRVYDIALELIMHGDGRVDAEYLARFVAAYQSISPLKLGELWAIPIMLRLALIENVRRVASRIAADRVDQSEAGVWADRMIDVAARDPKDLILEMADLVRSDQKMSSAFVAEFARRLQGRSACLTLVLDMIIQQVAEQGLTIDDLIRTENQKQAADQVTLSNSIISIHVLESIDWREFVESMSTVEQVLRGDPADIYGRMDFDTRDHYRHVVEGLARRCSLTEIEIAEKAVDLASANRAPKRNDNDRTGHVGYFLVGRGLPALKHQIGARIRLREQLRKITRSSAVPIYLGSIFSISALITAAVLGSAATTGLSLAALIALGVLLLLCSSHFSVSFVNWLSTMLVSPKYMPRIEFSNGVPPESRTLVVVPTMLSGHENIRSLLDGLEIRYLGNQDPNIHFALLTDFRDAPEETMPGDDRLVKLAEKGIEDLNRRYGGGSRDRFFLFHRPRLWNAREKIWMGYERKRGKLADLNAFLRGRSSQRFALIAGDTTVLSNVKYVITLDTDTELPRDVARALVGAMSHPLNRATYSASRDRVIDGYTILQPRVAVTMPAGEQSWFLRLFGGDPGIDPYTRSVSDVYQDLFGEGSYIGKGIYDVDVFTETLEGRFPENRILSHDLLEGCHARAGLITDVQLFEDYPQRYMVDVSRRHRWIRGDWQIASWLLPGVRGAEGKRVPNPLSLLSKWKIFDNLRRSLLPLGLTLLLLLGWTVLAQPLAWTLVVAGIIFLTPLLLSWAILSRKPVHLTLGLHLGWALRTITKNLAQTALTVVLFPFDAYFSLDAICRTAFRLLITRRRLLEWTTSSDSLSLTRSDLPGYCRSMWFGPALSVAGGSYLAALRPEALVVAGPFLAAWFASPLIAWWISRLVPSREAELTDDQTRYLRGVARKTWRFFETFVGPEDHWLPPDNYQEEPAEALAHRTSPTNMGLALLANLTAHDFGYIPVGTLIDRTARTLDTMGGLQRYRKHFFNWYDTRTLEPLHPHYVSTVDSGNLAGHLVTLRQGLLELNRAPCLPRRLLNGLSDTLDILLETATQNTPAPKHGAEATLVDDAGAAGKEAATGDRPRLDPAIRERIAALRGTLEATRYRLPALRDLLVRLNAETGEIVELINPAPHGEAHAWAVALRDQCRGLLHDLELSAPWSKILSDKPSWEEFFESEVSESIALTEKIERLYSIPSPREIAGWKATFLAQLDLILDRSKGSSRATDAIVEDVVTAWFRKLRDHIAEGIQHAEERIARIDELAQRCLGMADFDYEFLYDKTRRLLVIGYNVSEHRRDNSYYDLLASEARLCSFVAIAQGHLPQDHWFALGRLLTVSGRQTALISWGGSMFEYLMPLLVMPNYDETLLGRSCRAVVASHVYYGQRCGVPWGISESGYNAIDVHKNYQYRSFGVPGLGYRHDLAEDLVTAPYASALALMIQPGTACANLMAMSSQGFEGRYGFYEAIDFTPVRRPPGQSCAIVRSFMAHHQGMSLLSIAHALLNRPMQRRFLAEPIFQATELLLQERIPKARPFDPQESELTGSQPAVCRQEPMMRVFEEPDTPIPEVHFLTNGRYSVMVTNSGGGYSRWRDIALTRWHEDTTRDHWGNFCYIRDVESDQVWSSGYHPVGAKADDYEAIFLQARAEFRRRDGDFDTYTRVVVSPEDDIELRRIKVTNHSPTTKTIELTSYAEVVLAPPSDDASHPVFSNLFVQTEIVRNPPVILCTRRKRTTSSPSHFMFHMLTLHETKNAVPADESSASFETDRAAFIGRCRDLKAPAGLTTPGPLTDSQGSVLDPIVAIRRTVAILPEESAQIDIVTGIAETRDQALSLAEKYHDRFLAARVFDLAWTHAQVVLRQLNMTEADAQLYGRLASSLVFSNPAHRAPADVLARNHRGQSDLWGHGISGDLPIVLLRISDHGNAELVHQLVQAHSYWKTKGLSVDLVIWNEEHAGYRQPLQDEIMGMVTSLSNVPSSSVPGTVFVKNIEHVSEEDQILMQTVARVILSDSAGSLSDQIERRLRVEGTPLLERPLGARAQPPVPKPASSRVPVPAPDPGRSINTKNQPLEFFNGFGGFSRSGREYVIESRPGYETPAPWSNVLANPHFGTVITESGSSYTWYENANRFRLTPWYNDPVCDTSGEALYIRDEETGRFWSPTPLPARGATPYTCRHGFGYTTFEHEEDEIASRLTVHVTLHTTVKYMVLRLQNDSERSRRISATGYFELVMGERRASNAPYITTGIDPRSGAILARNSFNTELPGNVVFLNVNHPERFLSTDRTEFMGRNGTLAHPAAMDRAGLSGKTGAAVDPCAAMQVIVSLEPGQYRDVVFILGAARSTNEARKLIRRSRSKTAAQRAHNSIRLYWNRMIRTVQVETPDKAVDFLANGWLLYQTLSSRIWGRSGFYQSGGAYGFRDQLQDVMALTIVDPSLARAHLLLSASRQFAEGDVQHWWHPPAGRGVRTKFSDDFLWLPLAVSRYVEATGDRNVLDERIRYLQGRALRPDEEAYYDLPIISSEEGTLYEHCARSLKYAFRYGQHGLPLMGCGDWNDGMNLVGAGGKGESVWLGFFLHHVIQKFAEVARLRGDQPFVVRLAEEAARLTENLETNGWDGAWYRRAYFDDGRPLGSEESPECKIDAIPQSWAVLSGAGDRARTRKAMASVSERLVDTEARLIQLFDPPFDLSDLDPGYIKGYVPGVRENGGQYTHAAVWTVMAFAQLGENRRAWDLLSLINPILHGATYEDAKVYKVEPYVLAADVYSRPPHRGRGGWTWYTGSCGWMYRMILETLLGLNVYHDRLRFNPRLHPDWDRVKIGYRYRSTLYDISYVRTGSGDHVEAVLLGDEVQADGSIALVDDGTSRKVEVRIGG